MSTALDRLYRYKSLLTSRHAVPSDELMSRLGISIATIKRDIALLRERLHIPVEYDRAAGGYRLAPGAARQELPGLWLSSEELVALATLQQLLAGVAPGLLSHKLEPLRERLGRLLHDLDVDSERLAQRIRVVHAGQRRLPPEAFEHAAAATLGRMQLRIRHHNRETGQTLERTVSPQQLVHYRDNWYLDAWCHLRDGLRSFAVDAIVHSEVLADQPAYDVDPEALRAATQNSYGIFGGEPTATATLRFSAERARWVSREVWHPAQVARWNPDGSYELDIPYSDDRELVGDILKHGHHCQALAPASLKAKIAGSLRQSMSHYHRDSPDGHG